ncbi:hypothetical protein [Rhizobium sp. No.120]
MLHTLLGFERGFTGSVDVKGYEPTMSSKTEEPSDNQIGVEFAIN